MRGWAGRMIASTSCPNCGSPSPPGKRFCGDCGAPLTDIGSQASPALPVGHGRLPLPERRQLSVIFCDLVGSTALAARLDPEDLHGVITRYQRCCAEVIERAGGFVAKYMGDGVLAYFGYPQAHENDAERAVRAGLALVDEVGRLSASFADMPQARVGIA